VEARAAAVAVDLATSKRAAEQASAEVAALKAQVDSLAAALEAAQASYQEAGAREDVAKELTETKASLAKVRLHHAFFFQKISNSLNPLFLLCCIFGYSWRLNMQN